LPCLNIFYPW